MKKTNSAKSKISISKPRPCACGSGKNVDHCTGSFTAILSGQHSNCG